MTLDSLVAAAIMLPMIPLEIDEVVAMIQHLRQAKSRGDRDDSLWTIFRKGGTADGCTEDNRLPELITLPDQPWKLFLSSIRGMSFLWTLCAASVLGIWLMFSPTVFGTTGAAADIVHLTGSLAVVFSVISVGEVVRQGRWLNLLLAVMLVVGVWLFGDASRGSQINATMAGLCLPRGKMTERYGK